MRRSSDNTEEGPSSPEKRDPPEPLLRKALTNCLTKVIQNTEAPYQVPGAGEERSAGTTSPSPCFQKVKENLQHQMKLVLCRVWRPLGLEQGEQESTPVKLPRNPTGKGPHCHLRQTALPSPWASLQASEGLSSCQSVVLSSAPRRRGQVTCRYLMCHWTQTFPQKLSSPKQT